MSAMYRDSPAAYDVLHAARGKDYGREAAIVAERIRRHRPAARSVLDVACGTGLHLAAFADQGFQVEGLDLSEAMIAVARDRMPEVVQVPGEAVPQPGVGGEAVHEEERTLVPVGPDVGVHGHAARHRNSPRLHGERPYRRFEGYAICRVLDPDGGVSRG